LATFPAESAAVTDGLVAVLGRGIVDPTEPVVAADDLGFARGDGCFETCRVVTDGNGTSTVHNLAAHLARLTRSLATLDIDIDVDACENLVEQAVTAWSRPGEAAVRLVVTRGTESSGLPSAVVTVHPISVTSLRQRQTGIRVVTLPHGTSDQLFATADWLLGGVKTISYAVNMAALREAGRRGADDVIFTSIEGSVLEAPTATVLWGDAGNLFTTPTGASGILAGTTLDGLFRAAAAEGIRTGTATLAADDLPAVEGLWLASSVRGVVDVVSLDGTPRSRFPELTARLQRLAGF
jgi:4-amino-4-deoxychorismate lyase